MVGATPGPWRFLGPDVCGPSRVGVSGAPGNDIYSAPLTAETEANARLIAAAPDLLKAARKVPIARVGHPGGTGWLQCIGCDAVADEQCEPDCWAYRLEAAIAKAEGAEAPTW